MQTQKHLKCSFNNVKMSCFVQMCQMGWLLALWSAHCSASSWSSWSCGSSLTPWRNTSTGRWKRPRATRWSETLPAPECCFISSSRRLSFLEFCDFQLSLRPPGGALRGHGEPLTAFPWQPQPAASMLRRMSREPKKKKKKKKTAGATSEQREVRDVQASTCVILKGNQWDGANVWRLKCFLNPESFCAYHWSNL